MPTIDELLRQRFKEVSVEVSRQEAELDELSAEHGRLTMNPHAGEPGVHDIVKRDIKAKRAELRPLRMEQSRLAQALGGRRLSEGPG